MACEHKSIKRIKTIRINIAAAIIYDSKIIAASEYPDNQLLMIDFKTITKKAN